MPWGRTSCQGCPPPGASLSSGFCRRRVLDWVRVHLPLTPRRGWGEAPAGPLATRHPMLPRVTLGLHWCPGCGGSGGWGCGKGRRDTWPFSVDTRGGRCQTERAGGRVSPRGPSHSRSRRKRGGLALPGWLAGPLPWARGTSGCSQRRLTVEPLQSGTVASVAHSRPTAHTHNYC